ncbi:epididymal sperm-binding protein 1-like [Sphaerodactylus townsendi]|uniref:epididymal sperm-binding protein 1-like n=1 Tax=Sphaerodactylus townsendi TaxID=933632 RepID=UPI00202654EA|nr:epididymal sperm-binding protein 1-like [Sphaerodactylus townsendi]
MASSIVFLVYACALLPLFAAREDNAPCVFPFTYLGKSYSSCTAVDSDHGRLWCATTRNYDNDERWKWCGAEDSAPCVFPFIYLGKTYNSCAAVDFEDRKLWCATTHNYDKDELWRECTTKEFGGNSGGQSCHFPFIYWGQPYETCTTKHSRDGKPWCATTGNYDKDRKWSYCADTRLSADPMGPCHFPLRLNGHSWTTCVTDSSFDGEPWCSLTNNVEKDNKKVRCTASEPCSIPFTYKKRRYYACTKDGSVGEQHWCATTSNYDADKKWKTCVFQDYGGSSKNKSCVFPFEYKEKTYHQCTTEDEPTGRSWCATTSSYDKDGEWTFCADPGQETNHDGKCTFPFKYKNNTYSSCTRDGLFWGFLPWCSLTSDYNKDQKWKFCSYSERKIGH